MRQWHKGEVGERPTPGGVSQGPAPLSLPPTITWAGSCHFCPQRVGGAQLPHPPALAQLLEMEL